MRPDTNTPCVYILASEMKGKLYIGATSNLAYRILQHRAGVGSRFTRTYDVHRLIWYEVHDAMQSAFARERAMKVWRRDRKLTLISESNPYWVDLYDGLA